MDDPWLKEQKKWLDDYDEQYKHIKFIFYDSPKSYEKFISEVSIYLNNFYIIDEMHNFI